MYFLITQILDMQLQFMSGNEVVYTTDMAEDETFGSVIDLMCTAMRWNAAEWDFMFHSKFAVPRDWTPAGMGPPDEGHDVMTIYCRVAKTNN